MIAKEHLTNILVFMKRVTVTGEEALAWAQTYEAVNREIQALAKVAEPPKTPSTPPAAP